MAAYATTTLATLRARLRDRTESVPFWTDTEATLALNEALRIWNLCTGQWRRRVQIATRADDQYVSLPAPMLWPMHVEWNGRPLTKAGQTELGHGKPGWQAQRTTDGGAVPSRVEVWSPVSLGLITIWPIDGAGTGTLTIDGVANTPVLALAGDFVDISDAQLNALTDYGLHYLAFKQPGALQGTLPLRRRFFAAAGDQNALFRASALYRTVMSGDPQQKTRPPRVPNTPPPMPEAEA